MVRNSFVAKEWEWLGQQPNFMKLTRKVATLEQYEGLVEVGLNMLNAIDGRDRAALIERLQQYREQMN